jgi:hypothetical protein
MAPFINMTYETICLIPALVWLVNGLHSRPDDRNHARNLVHCCLPHTDHSNTTDMTTLWPYRTSDGSFAYTYEEEDENHHNFEHSLTHVIAHGIVFFKSLKLPPHVPMPRLPSGYFTLSKPAFCFYFGKDMNPARVRQLMKPIGIAIGDLPTRITGNRSRITPRQLEEAVPGETDLVINLTSLGVTLESQAVDEGEDRHEAAFLEESSTLDPDARVTNILRQFYMDVAFKSPNPRGATEASYLLLTKDERGKAGRELYLRTDLQNIFQCFYYVRGTLRDFEKAFDYLFPPKNHVLAGKQVQNYKTCRYYTDWKELTSYQSTQTVDAMRYALRREFNRLQWIPEPAQDKVWVSRSGGGERYMVYPDDHTGAAPRILTNFNFVRI